MSEPLLTAIVSTYNAERFMRGCLEALTKQTMLDELEILVIDSGSQQGEAAICAEFAQKFPQIRYVRTEREPLYAAWNRAIALARGKYLTSANTDDRHHPQFTEVMVHALEASPQTALVYADQWISHTENETFEECEARGAKRRRWPDYTTLDMMLRGIAGPQPVWRKSLHASLGVFDVRYQIAADYDMWLRIAEQHPLLHIDRPLGVVYESSQTISGTGNRIKMNSEFLEIQSKYIERAPWREVPGVRKRLAAEIFGRGYQHITFEKNVEAAKPFIRQALKLDPTNLRYLKTYVVRCLVGKQ